MWERACSHYDEIGRVTPSDLARSTSSTYGWRTGWVPYLEGLSSRDRLERVKVRSLVHDDLLIEASPLEAHTLPIASTKWLSPAVAPMCPTMPSYPASVPKQKVLQGPRSRGAAKVLSALIPFVGRVSHSITLGRCDRYAWAEILRFI